MLQIFNTAYNNNKNTKIKYLNQELLKKYSI